MDSHIYLTLSVFVASAVEMIEALTIVMAIGTTRDWRSTITATSAALITLALIIALLGKSLTGIVSGANSNHDLEHLWLIAGSLLLIFGLQWLKKSIMRFSGLLATRDEEQVYKKVTKDAKHKALSDKGRTIDWYAFVIVYKGVLLEGLEVVFIIIAFGAAQNGIRTGAIAAIAALVVVTLIGVLIRGPLSKVPENTMKFVVGALLTTFGTYFSTKGIGVVWPHGDNAVPVILVFYLALSYLLVRLLKDKVMAGQRGQKG